MHHLEIKTQNTEDISANPRSIYQVKSPTRSHNLIYTDWTRLKFKLQWRGTWHSFDLSPSTDY